MKTRQLSLILMIVFSGLFFPGTIGFSQQNAGQLFEKALYLEEAKGDLREAVNIYNQIAEDQNAGQSIQAKALLHLGMCHEKLGNHEAINAYKKLVSNFPSQKNEVSIAKDRFSKLTSTAASEEIAIKQVWASGGIDISTSISGDGQYISFTDWKTGNLVMQNLQTGEKSQLTFNGTWKTPLQYAEASLLSQDATQIAYLWYNDKGDPGYYELRTIQADGQKQTVLHSFEKNVIRVGLGSWFLKNNKIIFQTYSIKGQWYLSSVDVNTSEVQILIQKVLKPQSKADRIPNVVVSPDEKYVVFDFPDSLNNGMYDIYRISIDSKKEYPIIKHPGNDLLIGWLPGRNEMLFTSDRSGTIDLWAITYTVDNTSVEPKFILSGVGNMTPMQLTKQGSLYYRTNFRLIETSILSFNSENGTLFDNQSTTFPGVVDVHWLPDGESLICRSMMTMDQNLIVYNIKSGERRILADNIVLRAALPRISPDGNYVLVFGMNKQKSNDKREYYGIYSIDINTGIPVELNVKQAADKKYPSLTNCQVEWDEDGKNIYYVHDHQIIKHNILTGEEKTIYTDDNELFYPTLRRTIDGKSLVLDGGIKEEQVETPLLIIPEDGGEARTLCNFNVGNKTFISKQICQSPDGKYIYYSESSIPPDLKSIVYRIPTSGGIPEKIWQPNDYIVAGMSFHPDGRQIAISKVGILTEIREIQNLGKKVAEIFSEDK